MSKIQFDLYRYAGKTCRSDFIKTYIRNGSFRLIYALRGYQGSSGFKQLWYRFLYHQVARRIPIDLSINCTIDEGILLLHPYSIVINNKTRIGKNCTILGGVTIGNTKTGNIGVPTIGDNVYIGPNAVIVGNIKVGDNSLIAGNAFVNFDIPDNSVVVGNPGIIHYKANASFPYIINSIMELETR